ncbi:hypothetical protein [Palleronia caenipelagi]|uniref:Uncharacterized protein n=1 Tax=Palleronia caenipelagi TaxID=2489174 RepID=A0A547PIL9_9RHOB|nr:hypothetical protein [Palleronia caenipelagi]TRD13987.1 hypothetical protein FEV53_19665 [Palleronia caenipelagi]
MLPERSGDFAQCRKLLSKPLNIVLFDQARRMPCDGVSPEFNGKITVPDQQFDRGLGHPEHSGGILPCHAGRRSLRLKISNFTAINHKRTQTPPFRQSTNKVQIAREDLLDDHDHRAFRVQGRSRDCFVMRWTLVHWNSAFGQFVEELIEREFGISLCGFAGLDIGPNVTAAKKLRERRLTRSYVTGCLFCVEHVFEICCDGSQHIRIVVIGQKVFPGRAVKRCEAQLYQTIRELGFGHTIFTGGRCKRVPIPPRTACPHDDLVLRNGKRLENVVPDNVANRLKIRAEVRPVQPVEKDLVVF